MAAPRSDLDLSPLSLTDWLAEHANDSQRALSSLIARHNRLLHDVAVLRQEKDAALRESQRAALENQQLWRNLKVTSPRPTTQRQNSEGSSGAGHNAATQRDRDRETARGLGIGTLPERASSTSLRKVSGGSSNESTARYDLPPPLPTFSSSPRVDSYGVDPRLASTTAQSSASLRTKAATPPPAGSPRLNDPIAPSNLRKASSLDLGRSPTAQSDDAFAETTSRSDLANGMPRTPPSNNSRPSSRDSSPRLPTSASMPSMALNERGRFLPSITPVSPLMHEISENSVSPTARENSISSSEALQQQLQLPNGPQSQLNARIRDRTFSNQSGSSTLASAFEDRIYPSRTASMNPLPSTSSSYSLATLSDSPSVPRERRQDPLDTRSSVRAQHHNAAESDISSASAPPTRRGGGPLSPPSSNLTSTGSSSSPSFATSGLASRPILNPSYLPFARVRVCASTIKLNDRNKETISFTIEITLTFPASPSSLETQASWRVEKSFSEILVLDAAVKAKSNRQERSAMVPLPDKSLFKDHAPHRSDQRKAVLERYFQTLISISLRDRTAICNFFNTDIANEPNATTNGAMEGYLTKRGRNFGGWQGWQTRFYVLTPGSCLSYFESPNGNKLGEIPLQGAAIGRQSSSRAAADGTIGEDAYLHAFLIRTQNEKEKEEDHILCAESDEMRDRWVNALTTVQTRTNHSQAPSPNPAAGAMRTVNNRERTTSNSISSGPLPPPTVIATSDSDPSSLSNRDRRRSGSGPAMSSMLPEQDPRGLSARLAGDLPPSVSLPANLDSVARSSGSLDSVSQPLNTKRPNDPDATSFVTTPLSNKLQPPSSRRNIAAERPHSPDGRRAEAVSQPGSTSKYSASDVSGPMNAVPLPSGYEFKKSERQKKTKSSFWNFSARGSNDKNSLSQPQAPSRPVFGVPLREAVAISRIRPGLELPAVVYRCVEYLEAKNAEHEEGIFRLSGSANVIRVLKDRFNAEGDVNLVQSNEYYDPHAIAGLLKQYLRELPVHLLTRELHPEFLRVIDLRARKDRVNALGQLVARLPIEEYTLFRFFFAHLCVIAQNAETSKMNLRNLGIVFSPTLAIPAPLFALFLLEFDLVFAVEKETGNAKPIMVDDEAPTDGEADGADSRRPNRNSQLYQASNADKLMETELTKLRETEEIEDDTVADAVEDAENDLSDRTVGYGPGAYDTTQYYSTYAPTSNEPGLAVAQPRSPGLHASPRPGAIFETSATPITPTR
ncbi:uncharacterized protein JCM15063_003666 [Sporobolomyces koalae]|uniref:uncharacterized protein n=1 Tax=Sporobolomyces koalae TaxID=500713 RepID=UPI003175C8DC